MDHTRAHRHALDRLYAGEALPGVFSVGWRWGMAYPDATPEGFACWREEQRRRVAEGEAAAHDTVTFLPRVIEFWPLGVHFVDALYGARVFPRDDNFWTAEVPGHLAGLPALDVRAHPLVTWALECTGALLEEYPAQYHVSTPVFASPLNIALNLYGERALADLAAPTPATLAALDRLTADLADLHCLWKERFPEGRVRFYCSSDRFAPDGVGHLCGCSTHLLGPETYARYLAPLDQRLLSLYPGGGTMHLCGQHTQHLPTWREMAGLRGVQLNDAAADDFPAYFAGLREDQVVYVAPTPRMTVASLLEISGGRRLVLQTRLQSPLPCPNLPGQV